MTRTLRVFAGLALSGAALLPALIGCTTSGRTSATQERTPTYTASPTWTVAPTNTPKSYVVVAGGYTSGAFSPFYSTVYAAEIASNGSLVGWIQQANALPDLGAYRGYFSDASYLYVVGGWSGGGSSSAVYSASVAAGVVGVWNTLAAYPQPVYGGYAARAGGFAFVAGGYNSSTYSYSSSVYSASLNGSGGLGAWNSTTALPAIRWGASIVSDGSYLYAIGGWNSSAATNTVYVGTISGGNVTSWAAGNPVPALLTGQAAVYRSGYLYVFGGDQAGGYTTTYIASASGGNVGTWFTSNPVPGGTNVYSGIAVTHGGFLYYLGRTFGPRSAAYSATVNGASVGGWNSEPQITDPLGATSAGVF